MNIGIDCFRVRLLSDVVVSASSAHAGQHRGLDFLPGALFLGVVARRYDAFAPEVRWDLFHSGRVRFGCAYLLGTGDRAAVPVPLAWEMPKDGPADDGRVMVENHAREPETPRCLPADDGRIMVERPAPRPGGKQMRTGYVAQPMDDVVSRSVVATAFRRKTAVNPWRRNAARSGHLFGYEGIQAGQDFWFQVTWGKGISEAVRSEVREMLSGTVGLGRSRSAEYGQAAIAPWTPVGLPGHGLTDGQTMAAFYLLTDTCFIEGDTGAPTLRPTATAFGLPPTWEAKPEHTFVRGRRYAPYNAWRHVFDPERLVATCGSVFVFTGPALGPEAVRHVCETLDDGVGLHLQDGLGHVIAEPWCLARDRYVVTEVTVSKGPQAKPPDEALVDWLVGDRYAARVLPDLAAALAAEYESHFRRLYEDVVGEARRRGEQPSAVAPSRAQWGEVRQRAQRAGSLAALRAALIQGDKSLCDVGVARKVWGRDDGLDPRPERNFQRLSFGALLGELMDEAILKQSLDARADVPVALRERLVPALARQSLVALANRMPRLLAQFDRDRGEERQ